MSTTEWIGGKSGNLVTLDYYRIFVTILTPGVPDPVFKNETNILYSTSVYHKKYTENISLTEQFQH